MFTGIIEEVGTVERVTSGMQWGQLTIRADVVLDGSKLGDSIAVNGVCLTVANMVGNRFTADVMAETLRRSNLGSLMLGSSVNLERAMPAEGRFGGHIVTGHIDGLGTILERREEGNAVWIKISASQQIMLLIIEKGSIAIDGISLTVAELGEAAFGVSVIPHTGKKTTLLTKKAGDIINLENDVIGKYVQRMLSSKGDSSRVKPGITMEFLQEHGF